MMLHDKKTLVSKQYEYLFFTVLQSVTNRDGEYQQLAAECETLTRILVATQC